MKREIPEEKKQLARFLYKNRSMTVEQISKATRIPIKQLPYIVSGK